MNYVFFVCRKYLKNRYSLVNIYTVIFICRILKTRCCFCNCCLFVCLLLLFFVCVCFFLFFFVVVFLGGGGGGEVFVVGFVLF